MRLRVLGVNASAVVAHRQPNILARRQIRSVSGIGQTHLDSHLPALGHGVTGVQRQVDQRQLQLAGIHCDARHPWRTVHAELHTAAQHNLDQRLGIVQIGANLQRLRPHPLASCKAHQVLREVAAHIDRAQGGREWRLHGTAGIQPLHQMGAVADDAQHVVEVVRHTAGEPTQRLCAKALRNALLGNAGARHRVLYLAFQVDARAVQLGCCVVQGTGHLVDLGDTAGPVFGDLARAHARSELLQRTHRLRDAARHPERATECQRKQQERGQQQRPQRAGDSAQVALAGQRGEVGPALEGVGVVAHRRNAVERNRFKPPFVLLCESHPHVGCCVGAHEAGAAGVTHHKNTLVVNNRCNRIGWRGLPIDQRLQFGG